MTKSAILHKKQADIPADELQLMALLRDNTDIFQRHPELLIEMDVPHKNGSAVSLIERQVAVLRQKNHQLDTRLCELMDVARDNQRLAESRHRIAVNLLAAHDLDDVISIVLDELSNELKADYAVIHLLTDNQQRLQNNPALFLAMDAEGLNVFKTMQNHKNPVCGRGTGQQKRFLFGADAQKIESVAIIPLYAGADLGLIGLGGNQQSRFQATMGTHFLAQMGELVSAALAVHLEGSNL